uniref:Triosephosphate isomerase n=1 Tax=Globodera pallida TaxID=36090 RepID=A0A183CSE0_GLOPA
LRIYRGRAQLRIGRSKLLRQSSGAFTGEISAQMLQSIGVQYVLIGHSERRQYFNETNALLAEKITESLFHLSEEQLKSVVIAYEPIWAIGTGLTASAEQAQEMHAALRAHLASKYGAEVADEISILYGGSVTAASAPELFAAPDIDGGLVGFAVICGQVCMAFDPDFYGRAVAHYIHEAVQLLKRLG